jgi:hypothetical protein
MTEVKPLWVGPEELKTLTQIMDRKYAAKVKDRYFEAELTKDGVGVYAKVTLRDRSGKFYYPVEGRMAHADHDMNVRDAGLFLLDYMDAYFDEYFKEDGDVFLPIDWADFDCEGVALQLKGQIFNLEVERLADEILAKGGYDPGDTEPAEGSKRPGPRPVH